MQNQNDTNLEQATETNTPSENIESVNQKKKIPFTKSFLDQLEIIVIFFAIAAILFAFVFKTCKVDGDSMKNTLYNEENVLIWSLFYTPDYGDIVVIHDNDKLQKPIVKRVIGLPGDSIHVEHYRDSMQVIVTHSDGSVEEINEPYIYYNGNSFYYQQVADYTVGDGEVFVMGDNRLNSEDSRKLGCYDSRQILGKVIFRISPLDKLGTVE